MHCELCIIGAGPGGYRAAEYAAKQGLKVVIFEAGEVGGTCLNVGCIPTKTYVHSATFDEARERMSQVVSQLRAGVEGILSHPNITLVPERGVFVDDHTVNGYTAPNIIIATGSETKLIPVEGLDDPRVVDSTGLLALETLPKKLCIIGAGVIGMEFASVFQRFGSEVTVIEYLKECIPALDSDIAKRLRKLLEKRGITFHMKTAVQSLKDIDADVILMATGRKPRTAGLNLEAAGITLAPNGAIPVDDNFKVTLPGGGTIQNTYSPPSQGGATQNIYSPPSQGGATQNIYSPPSQGGAGGGSLYAIGDVNGRQMLAHAAEMQAVRVINQILGKKDGIRFDIMPAAIFTEPEAACVGLSEDQLKEQGIPYVCKKAFWRANGKALAMNETEGMLKLFASPTQNIYSPPSQGGTIQNIYSPPSQGGARGGSLLGCHAYGAHAADIIQEVSVLMCKNTTLGELADMVHIHPTLSEILRNAAE